MPLVPEQMAHKVRRARREVRRAHLRRQVPVERERARLLQRRHVYDQRQRRGSHRWKIAANARPLDGAVGHQPKRLECPLLQCLERLAPDDDACHQVRRVVATVEGEQFCTHIERRLLGFIDERALVAPAKAVVRVLGLHERAQDLPLAHGVVLGRLLKLLVDSLHLAPRAAPLEERAREEGAEATKRGTQVRRMNVEVEDGRLRVRLGVAIAAMPREELAPAVLLGILTCAHEGHVLNVMGTATEMRRISEVADPHA